MAVHSEKLVAEATADVAKATAQLKLFDEAADEAAEDRRGVIHIETDYDRDWSRLILQQLSDIRNASMDTASAISKGLTPALNNAGRSAGSAGGGFRKFAKDLFIANGAMDLFGKLTKILKWPVLIWGVQQATAAITALSGAVVGLVSALRPLTGLLAAIPQGFALLGQTAGAAFLGLSRVGAALKAQGQAQDAATRATLKGADAARKQADAQRDLESASRGVEEAQKDVERATIRLSKANEEVAKLASGTAREAALEEWAYDSEDAQIRLERSTMRLADARKKLNDLLSPKDPLDVAEAEHDLREAQQELWRVQNYGTGSTLELEEAQLKVQRAQQKLNKMQGQADPEEVAEAQLDIRDAEQENAKAQRDLLDIQQKLNDIQKIGAENSQEMIDAREAQTEATEDLSDAQWQLTQRQQTLVDAQAKLKTSTEDVDAATAKFKQAYDELTPAGQRFVDFVDKQLRPKLDDLKRTAESNLLDGLRIGLQNALPLFNPLKQAIADTSSVLGDIATDMGSFVGSDFFTGKFKDVADSNTKILKDSLGPAMINFASGLTSTMHAARPLVEFLGSLVLKASEMFKVWAEGKDAMGTGAFADTINVLKILGDILGDLWAGFGNVFDAAKPLGDWLLARTQVLTQKFREWTGEAENMNKMTSFFEALKPPLSAISALVGDLAQAFFRVSAGTQENNWRGLQTLTTTIEDFRTKVIPPLERLFTSFQDAFGPAVIDALGNVIDLFTTFLGHSGALTRFVEIIGWLAGKINDFTSASPAANAAFASLATSFGILKTFSLSKKLADFLTGGWASKLLKKVNPLKKKGALLDCTSAVTCTDTTTGKVNKLGSVFQGLGAKAKTAGGALKTGLQTVMTNIGSTAKAMGPKITTALAGLGPMISGALTAVGGALSTVAGLIVPWGLIVAGALALGVVLWKNKDKILEFFGKLGGLILDVLGDVGSWLLDVGKKILEGLWNGLMIYLDVLKAFYIDLPLKILGWLADAGMWLFEIGKSILEGLWKGIVWFWENVIVGAFNIAKWIGDKFLGAVEWLFEAGKTILTGLWNGLKWIWENSIKGLFNVAKWIKDIFLGAVDWLFDIGKSILTGLWNGIWNYWTTIFKGAFNVVKWIKDAIPNPGEILKDIGGKILGGLKDGILGKLGDLKDAVGGIGKKLVSWKGPPGEDEKLLVNNGELIMNGLSQGLMNQMQGLYKLMQGFTQNFIGIMADSQGDLENPGGNLLIGLWKGMRNQMQWIYDNVGSFASNVLGIFKKTFSIFSPSKVTESMGEMLSRGLAKGITSEGTRAIKAAAFLAGSVNDTFAPLRQGVDFGVSGGVSPYMPRGMGGGTVVNNYTTVQGSVVTERQLSEIVRRQNIQNGKRNATAFGRYG